MSRLRELKTLLLAVLYIYLYFFLWRLNIYSFHDFFISLMDHITIKPSLYLPLGKPQKKFYLNGSVLWGGRGKIIYIISI